MRVKSAILSILTILFCCFSGLSQTDPAMQITFDLIPDPRAVKYRVQTTVGSLAFATAVECIAPPCIITGIEGTTTYKIKVAGLEANGAVGEYSTSISHMFASQQPLSPTSLSRSNATSTIPGKVAVKLSWTAITKFRPGTLFPAGTIVEYRIYQAGTGSAGTGAIVATTSKLNSYTVQGLSKHKSYQFWVTCVVNDIESYTSPALRENT